MTLSITLSTICLSLALLLAPVAQAAQPGLEPFDEAPQDKGFLAFRNRMLAAIESRDAKTLSSMLDENILNSFGGSGGIPEFHAMWETDKPESKLWATLKGILEDGGCFAEENGERSFMAPWTWCLVVKTDLLEGYDTALAMKKGTPLLARPSDDAEVLQRLDYEVLRIVAWDGEEGVPEGFYKVETRSGEQGWMRMESVRLAIGYRAIFEQRDDGRWVMSIFVAGD